MKRNDLVEMSFTVSNIGYRAVGTSSLDIRLKGQFKP
jgi:hypothetical protein